MTRIKKTKKVSSVRLFHIFSGLFLILTIFVLLGLGTTIGYQDQQETYTLAEKTVSYLETECKKFDKYEQGNSARMQQDLLDAAVGLKTYIDASDLEDSDFLNEFIRTEHVGGVLILDKNLSMVAQADMDDQNSYSVWEDVIRKDTIKDILKHPQKTYIDQITLQNISYDFTVIANADDTGLILCYASRVKPSTDPYEYMISSILENNSFYKNPVMVITDGNQVLSTNDETVKNQGTEPYQKLKKSINWKEDQLTSFGYDNTMWYGLRRVYSDYCLYVVYPSKEVFSNRSNFVVAGFMIYLVICLLILSVQRYFDKNNLHKMEKQLRIIDAISTSFSSTFLLHVDRMELEMLKASDRMKTVFEEHKNPYDFLFSVCRKEVAPEYYPIVMNFLELDTLAERVKNQQYLGKEVRDIQGTWYSIVVIPQKYDAEGNVQVVLIAVRDISAMKQVEELSFKDKLTGLYNRNYMESRSKKFVRSGDYPVTLIMADCNYLKRTNDTLGHEYGDLLLQRVATVIKESVPENCIAMRVGGDEFLILCMKYTVDEAETLVAEMKEKLRIRSDRKLQLSVSFGIATIEDDTRSFDQAYKLADQAMYEEKKASRAGREDHEL